MPSSSKRKRSPKVTWSITLTVVALVVAGPVVTPVVQELGYDLVWFGVIMVKFLEIGLITPPVGLNVYILKGVVGDAVPLETIFKGILWFLAMDILTLGVLIYWPEISLWLPRLMLSG